MVDFEGGKRGGFDVENGSDEAFDAGSNEFQEAPVSYSPGTRFLVPDANGVVILPEGASLEDMRLQGGDLVVTLADGSVYVFPDAVYLLPDGSIFVPQIVAEGVALDPTDVLELLNPEGPGLPELPVRGSGGNFEEDPGNIQDAFDLGDLLPFTELSRTVEFEEEIFPDVDGEPEVVIETPDSPTGVQNAIATVDEAGLPARGEEPQGTEEPTDSETTGGTIVFNSPDGISAIIIDGVEITSVGQVYTTPIGELTITSINLDTGEIGFEYTLTDNTTGDDATDTFDVTVVDTDGDTADATLTVNVLDDDPIALNDANSVPAGSYEPISGNVVDNDESGADGYPSTGAVTGFSNEGGSAEPGDTLQGEFGTLTLNPDGSYTYERDEGTPGGVEESFDYTITDADGSPASAVLTITIGDAPVTIIEVPDPDPEPETPPPAPPPVGAPPPPPPGSPPPPPPPPPAPPELPTTDSGAIVYEAGLPERGDESEGTFADSNIETTTGTITFTAPDGPVTIVIDGVEITGPGVTVSNPNGILEIIAVDPVNGTIEYTFTLGDNTDGDDTSAVFEITVTDQDGDSDTENLVIEIFDDIPAAFDDSGDQQGEDAPVTVDAFANDVEGADSVDLGTIAVVDGTLSGAGEVVYNDDGTFTYTPAPGEEGSVTFDYTITDGDGDVSTATVTIDLLDDSIPEIAVEGGTIVDEAGLPARGDEPAGSDEAADSEIASGSIPIDTGNDTVGSLVINGVDVTAGGTVPTDKGVLTITLTDGEYSYSYELTDNTLSDPDTDAFELVVTDSDGDMASTDLVINILDDVPTAVDDTDSLDEGGPITTSGNVITDAEANGDNGADTEGADGAVVQNAGNIPGTYGDLVLNADGSYTYTLTAFGISQLETLSDGEFFTEVFDYTLVDGDGDTDDATLTITLNGEDDIVTVNGLDGNAPEVSLDEDDLANVGDDQGSDQSDPLTQDGTFSVTSPDGLDDVQVNGVDVVVDGVFTATEVANDGIYSVEVTSWTPTFAADGTTVIGATFDYTATLLDNSLAHTGLDDAALVEMLTVTADDVDGSSDSAVLDVEIVDDTPTAVDDTDSLTEGGPVSTAGNVITDAEANGDNGADTTGADGATVQNAGNIAGTYGDLVLNADGSYTYTLSAFGISQLETLSDGESFVEVFDYTLVDGDGDTSDATLTITLNGEDDIVTVNGLDNQAPEVSLDEDDLANLGDDQGSDQSDPLFQDGTFGVTSPDGLDDVQVNGVDVVVDGMFTATEVANDGVYSVAITGWTPTFAADGTTVISATFDYTATLLDNTLAHASLGEDSIVEMLTVTADDQDGSSDSAVLDVEIVDDIPEATDNSNSVGEGGTVNGNVVTDDDGDGVDVSGADGYAAAGAVVSVRTQDGLTIDATPDGAGNYTVATTLGTLTINQDGSYTYASNANSTNVDAVDTFIYTIRDGDGDESEAELVIDIANVAGQVSDNDVEVNEAGLPVIGSDAASDSEIDADGQITVIGAAGTLVYTLTGANSDGDGTFGTLALDSATGEYTYTLDTPFGHDPVQGTNVEADAESFTYEVRDTLGNLIGTGSIDVDIIDDIPNVELAFSGNGGASLITQDAETEGAAFDTATGDFSDAFAITTEVFGADGMGSVDTTYDLTLLAAAGSPTGLSSDGAPIFIYELADGTIVGSTAAVAPASVDASVIFSLEIDENAGEVTLTQFAEIDHALPGDSSNYDAQLADLASGLVGVTATADIVDGDGDTDTSSQTLDLGGLVQFADDGPVVTLTGATEPVLTVDETDFNADATASFAGAFSTDFGADGAGTVAYALDATVGASGLVDTLTGDPVLLSVNGGNVEGRTAGGDLVFTVSVDAATGEITLDQARAVIHPDDMDPNDPISIADGLITLTATATDGDGDTDAETINIGDNLTFLDDGPTLTGASLDGSVDLDETNGLPESATSTDPILDFTAAFGADDDGGTEFTIDVTDANSGLTTTDGDQAITLVQIDDSTIEGQFGAGLVAFTVEINADGTLTVTQNVALEHAIDGDDSAGEHNDTLDLTGKISATVEITDGDDDTASGTVPIGGAITFFDDGPMIDAAVVDGDTVVLNTQDAETIGGNTDTATSAANFGGAFTVASSSFGEDGAGSIVWDFGLEVVSGVSGLSSDGDPITLAMNGDVVEGRTSGGDLVFDISVAADTGVVTLNQYEELDHPLPGVDTNYDAQELLLGNGLVNLNGEATITDGDGDTASETVTLDLGGNIAFDDDGPNVTLTGATDPVLTVDETDLTTDAMASFAGAFSTDFGADGAGTVAYALDATVGASGLVDTLTGDPVLLSVNGGNVEGRTAGGDLVFTVSVDAATGEITLDQARAVIHPDDMDPNDPISIADGLITLTATATDGDGDTDAETINIGDNLTFLDDGPLANDDSDTIAPGGDEATGNVITGVGTDNPVTGEDDAGADEPATISGLANLAGVESDTDPTNDFVVDGEYGQLTLLEDGSYTYDRTDGSAGGVQDVFTYTLVDADGDTSEATLTINIGDLMPTAADGNAQLDDDGLAGANTLVGANDIDADAVDGNGNEALFQGSLGGSGGDGALVYAWLLPADTTLGQESITFALSPDGMTITGTVNGGARDGTALVEAAITDAATGSFTVTLLDNVLHIDDANDDEDGTEISTIFDYTVTDVDGDTDQGAITVEFNDDVPTLGPIVDQSISNEPGDPVLVGDLGLSSGADGLGEIIIATDVTGLTAGGQPLTTEQVGNVLTATAGGNTIFTITVDPDAGATGTYTFDLVNPLDGVVTDVPIGGSSAFGAGPDEQGQALEGNDGTVLSVVSGYNPNGGFDAADWFANGNIDTTDLETAGVNGSTNGWGVDNNNFNQGEFFVWDFSSDQLEDPDGPGGFEPPAGVTLPDVSFAVFNFVGATATEEIQLVVRLSDGSFEPVTVTGADITNPAYTYTAPAGLFIESIEMYGEDLGGGGTKVDLVSVGVQDESINEDIPIKITAIDGDGDMVMTEFDVNVSDNAVTISNLIAGAFGGEGQLDEANLPIGSADPAGPTVFGGDFQISAPDGIDDLVIGGETVIQDGVFVGGSVNTPLGELIITGFDPNTGTVTYTYELNNNADHSGGDIFDDFTVELTDTDGDSDGATLSVQVIDDAPVPVNDNGLTSEATADINSAFVLDFSGSVNNSELDTMLDAVEAAAAELFSGTNGDVTITLIAFSNGSPSNGALTYGPFTSLADVTNQLDAINPAEGGSRPYNGTTNFSAAIGEVIDNFTPIADAENRVFFLSDGNPNRGLGNNGETLNSSTETAWNNFVSSNDIGVVSIGVGGGVNVGPLQDVDVDGEGSPILVDGFGDIVDALLDEIRPDPIDGNVLPNDAEGADGARVLSIDVDGVTYTWDGTAAITPSNGDPAIAGSSLDVDTALGGTFTFDFATGDYSYRPPLNVDATTPEEFDYALIDDDGSVTGATLVVTVQDAADITPVVLDLDGGGNAFSSLSAGIAYDYSGDGVKTQTAWVAAGSAILAYDMNADGIVNGASEFVFGGNGVTDLEALAANYDTNQDGVLNASDSTYGKFGVWIDADLDGVSDDGEFVTLTDAGITSIELVSDGIVYQAGEGDVTVYGTASYTNEDGSTGAVSDTAFATATDVGADMEALLSLTAEGEETVELAEASGLRGTQDGPELVAALEEIVDDVLAEGQIDAMIEHFAGEDTGFTGEMGYLNDNALAQSIDGGAFTFGVNTVADMTEDAAAMAVAHA